MKINWDDLSGKSQAATILAIIGVISLGLCGVTYAAHGINLSLLALLGALGLLISVAGLVLLGIFWLVSFLVGLGRGRDEPTRLFYADNDETPESIGRSKDDKDKR